MPEGVERSKRHHLVPQNYLRAWADDDGRVQVFDKQTGRQFITGLTNVALQTDFFTFDDEDGPTDVAEKALAEIEGLVAPVLEGLAAGEWPLDDEQRGLLANFLALHIARRPSFRELQSQGIRDVMRMVGKMTAAHPEAMRAHLREILDREPTEEEIRSTSEFMSSDFEVTVSRNHWAQLFQLAGDFVDPIFAMRWTRVEAVGGEFLTTDEPFIPWKHPDSPAWTSAGLLTAIFHTFPLSPRYGLVLQFEHDESGVVPNPGDRAATFRAASVENMNAVAALYAYRHVITRRGVDVDLADNDSATANMQDELAAPTNGS